MKAKAIVVRAHGGAEVIEYTEVDVADPGPDEVRIRQHAIGLNYIDVYYRTGLYSSALPHGLGFEGAGVVEAVGSNVRTLKAGDRVAYPQGPLGAYSELRTMPVATVVKLPAKISFEQGAAVMLKGLTVQYLFRQTYRLQGHETILFHAAAGGVGLIACQWARALGVKLIGTVSSPEKAALAKKAGPGRRSTIRNRISSSACWPSLRQEASGRLRRRRQDHLGRLARLHRTARA